MNYFLRKLVHWLVSLTLPPTPQIPTFKMEFDTMAKFKITFTIAGPDTVENDPKFKLIDRVFHHAVNDGDVVETIVPLSGGLVVVEPLDPEAMVAVQLFNRDSGGRLSEPAELLVNVPTPAEPPVLPVPAEPTFVIEEIVE